MITTNSSMISSFLLLQLTTIFLFMMDDDVEAQTLSDNTQTQSNMIPSQDSISNNFQPSLAVVIGMLAIMFSLTFILLLYAKFCHRASSVHNMTAHQIRDGLVRRTNSTLASGVDKTVVESLPFFRFSSLRGSKQGLECSVCLAKFQDVEILRLLPKCKHAFHVECIDRWLEKHSTCPLCRRKVSADDVSSFSASLRYVWNQNSELMRDEPSANLELYVEREENRERNNRSSRFRKKEEELPIQENMDICDDEHKQQPLHKFNHRINYVVSDFAVLKNRWSNVSSSDLMFLNADMLNHESSARFSSNTEIMESQINSSSEQQNIEKRCMSEIIIHPRFTESSGGSNNSNVKEDRTRKLWLPIATKTARWFANRETTTPPHSLI